MAAANGVGAPVASVGGAGNCRLKIAAVSNRHHGGVIVHLVDSLVPVVIACALARADVCVIVVATTSTWPRFVGHSSRFGDEIIIIAMTFSIEVSVVVVGGGAAIPSVVAIVIALVLIDDDSRLLLLVHGAGVATITAVLLATSLRSQHIQCSATEQ
jgi:hypothetical protein